MYPVEFCAPAVAKRADFLLLVVSKGEEEGYFRPELFPLTVFPKPQSAISRKGVLVVDPAGETTSALKRAGVDVEPLGEKSDLKSASVLVVGKKAYSEGFLSLAKKLGLEQAVWDGLNVLVFEQTAGEVLGLKLEEQSTRHVFMAQPQHPFLKGLEPEDFINLRGESDLIAPYPEAPPETEKQWPKRYFKWGNRGVVATFVYTKPHYAPFTPILECGFDLVNSPLLEAKMGKGRIVLCSVDVT
jgi:hypothetical protein